MTGSTEGLLRLACRARRGGGVIINYHTLEPDETEAHAGALSRVFELIGHEALTERLRTRESRPFCVMTFDDGKRSNVRSAEILAEMGIRATFYIVTDFISAHLPRLWFDRYDRLRREGAPPPGLAPDVIKQLPLPEIEARLARLAHGNGWDVSDDPQVAAMSWDDARRLRDMGHTIGAHSRRHAILTRLSAEEAERDVQASMAAVSSELGEPCRTFAFPNGNYSSRVTRRRAELTP